MERDKVHEYLEELLKKKLTLVGSRRFDEDSNIWILEEHEHEDIELIYFIDGEGKIKTTAGDENLNFYDILIHPQHVRHKELVDLHMRQEVINLFVRCEEPMDCLLNESFILKDDTGFIRNVFRMIEYHYERADELSASLIESYLKILMIYLLKSKEANSSQENNIIERMMEFVQDNYMNDLMVADLARAVHVSESYLSRIMKKNIAMSPNRYINFVRIEAAKRLLKTDLSVEAIAAGVGYTEVKYFSTIFKKTTGMTPSSYRKQMKEKSILNMIRD